MGTINKINVGGTEYDIVDSTALHSGDNALMIKYGETITDAKWHEIVFAYQEGKPIFCYATADAYSPSDSQEGIFYNLPLALLICNDYNTAETYGNQMHFGAVYEQVKYNNSDIQLNLVTSYWSGWDDGTFTIGWSNETQQITPSDVGKVDQQKLSTNATYPLLIATTNTIPQYGGHRGETGITSTLYANPSTGLIHATKVDGLTAPTTDAEAANKKYVDDTVAANDKKVQQSPVSTNATYPIIFKGSTGNTAATTTTGFTSTLYANPSTGLLYSNQIRSVTITASDRLILGSDTYSQGAILAAYSTAQGSLNGVSIMSAATGNTIGRFYEDLGFSDNNFYLNNANITNGTMRYSNDNGLLQVGALGVTETTGYTTVVPSSTTGASLGQVMFVLIE